jgi:hypothetical protein
MPNPLCSSQRSQIVGAQPACRIHLQTSACSKQSLPLLPHSGRRFLLHLRRLQNVLPFGRETAAGRGPSPCARARSSSLADPEHIPSSWLRDHPPGPSQASPGASERPHKKNQSRSVHETNRTHQNRRVVDRSARKNKRAGRSKSAEAQTTPQSPNPIGTDGPA